MYEAYLSSRKESIEASLRNLKLAGNIIAIWGAGKNGQKFLRMYDSDRDIVSAVFDKDRLKYGTRLPSGHVVVDHRKFQADVVILINSAYQFESRFALISSENRARVCCLDDVVFGGISIEEALDLSVKVPKHDAGFKIKIVAMTILYDPNERVVDNIGSYLRDIDKLYLWDNSSSFNMQMFQDLISSYDIEYIGEGQNRGIGYAINQVFSLVKKDFDWLITFDQDSIAREGMIHKMRSYADDDRSGIIVPWVEEPLASKDRYFLDYAPPVNYVMQSIQSGMMHRLDVMEKIGGYDERLFIDVVDLEYCARCRASGHSILRVNQAVLQHQDPDEIKKVQTIDGKRLFIGKYPPMRYYYQYRNNLYCAGAYEHIDPIFAKQCKNTLKAVRFNAENDVNVTENLIAIERAEKDAIQLLRNNESPSDVKELLKNNIL